jgi:ubiquitin C-terminal hydrolase
VNDKFLFPVDLDMSPFLPSATTHTHTASHTDTPTEAHTDTKAHADTPAKAHADTSNSQYELFGVLMQSGSANGGHYYGYA